jgi:hypothetical protein
MKVPWLNRTDNAGFLERFARGSLAMRKASIGATLGKRPFIAAVCLDQQKLDRGAALAIANGRDLQGQGFGNPLCAHRRVSRHLGYEESIAGM